MKCLFHLILFYFPFRFGRKKVIFGSLVAQLVSVLIQAFSPSWEVFCIMFTFVGASQISLYISAFVLGKHGHELILYKHKLLYSLNNL